MYIYILIYISLYINTCIYTFMFLYLISCFTQIGYMVAAPILLAMFLTCHMTASLAFSAQ